eukprot:40845-Chlamydomonas_euryale.AAC.14
MFDTCAGPEQLCVTLVGRREGGRARERAGGEGEEGKDAGRERERRGSRRGRGEGERSRGGEDALPASAPQSTLISHTCHPSTPAQLGKPHTGMLTPDRGASNSNRCLHTRTTPKTSGVAP